LASFEQFDERSAVEAELDNMTTSNNVADRARWDATSGTTLRLVYTWSNWFSQGVSEMPSESVRDVRSHLADVVDRADRDDQATVITRRGKPVAAVVPIEVLRKYQEWEEREINRIVDERMSSRSAAIPIEDVIQETLARSE
jgi:prevent-host-death family protein